jgi:hypothetical protein
MQIILKSVSELLNIYNSYTCFTTKLTLNHVRLRVERIWLFYILTRHAG